MLQRPEPVMVEPGEARLRRPMSLARWRLVTAAFVLAAVAVAIVATVSTYRYLVDDASQRGRAVLNFHAEAFQGALDKYRILPALMARRTQVRAMIGGAAFAEPDAFAARLSENLLSEHAALTGAYAIAVANTNGRIIASSNSELPALAVGFDMSRDTHFQVATEGRLGRETIVSDSGRRLYVFSSAVRQAGAIYGVVSVAVDIERLEQPWVLTRDVVMAFQPDGLIVLSNRDDLRLKRLTGGGDNPGLGVLRYRRQGVVEIADEALAGTYVMTRRVVAPLEWTMIDLVDAGPIMQRAVATGGLAGLAALSLALGSLFFLQRRQNLFQKLRDDRAGALRLERLVRERTRDLQQAHTELLQASKLAALGQMSASIAHEFNQPLAAILSNADNAETLISRGQGEQALDNLKRIRGLVERLGGISRALKTFARKPRVRLQPTSLRAAVDAALMVLQPRRRESGVDVRVSHGPSDPVLLAGMVRMEQVVVNLVSNAIDAALAAHPEGGGHVEVDIRDEGGDGLLTVRDNGSGVSVAPMEAVFDPFVTTKEGGEGLGLGLSITFNIIKDFSGSIAVMNPPEGGACFTVRVPLADAVSEAAQ
ncbi:ATP-binding protein [Tepidamorphus sp. 3E244]|uniref:ATP-binding protein n=1 Tax=Tepidamorphus sp. 3E244 TaxID=3385498 RepID=UPI0038FCA007